MFTNGIRTMPDDSYCLADRMIECFLDPYQAMEANGNPDVPWYNHTGDIVSDDALKNFNLDKQVEDYIRTNHSEDYAELIIDEHDSVDYDEDESEAWWDDARDFLMEKLDSLKGTTNDFLGWHHVAE